jgi:hypothetical protein
VEQGAYEIEARIDGNSLPFDWDILVNDRPLERTLLKGRDYYTYEPGFFAGDIRVTIISGRTVHADVQVVVDPSLFKLTRDEYAAMIADIRRATLALYHLGGVTILAQTALGARRADLVTLELVRANFPTFEQAVERILRGPSRVLTSASKRTDLMKARRIDDRSLNQAIQGGDLRVATIPETRAAPRFTAALRGHWIPQINETNRIEQTNIYEHRAILGFFRWLDALLARTLNRLPADVDDELAPVWRQRLERWRVRTARLRHHKLFNGLVSDARLQPTPLFRMNPAYATAFRAMMQIRGGLGDGQGLAPAVPIDRTFALYEMWCYISILLAVAETHRATRTPISDLLQGLDAPDQLGVTLQQGAESKIVMGDGLCLTYQRRFTPTADSEGARTLLLDLIPDMTFSRSNDSGTAVSLSILDPKYRVAASLLEGLRDLHVYRDAIQAADGRLVTAAVALTPRGGVHAIDPKQLSSDRPSAATVRPGHNPTVFKDLVASAIKAL